MLYVMQGLYCMEHPYSGTSRVPFPRYGRSSIEYGEQHRDAVPTDSIRNCISIYCYWLYFCFYFYFCCCFCFCFLDCKRQCRRWQLSFQGHIRLGSALSYSRRQSKSHLEFG